MKGTVIEVAFAPNQFPSVRIEGENGDTYYCDRNSMQCNIRTLRVGDSIEFDLPVPIALRLRPVKS